MSADSFKLAAEERHALLPDQAHVLSSRGSGLGLQHSQQVGLCTKTGGFCCTLTRKTLSAWCAGGVEK